MGLQFGTPGGVVKASQSFGGTLVVFEGKPELLVGGFNFNMDDLPDVGVVLPCGTPVNCDESNRTITPLVTVKVKSVDGTDAKKITLVSNGFNGPALKVGQYVAIINDTLATQYENTTASGVTTYNYVQIAAISGDVITLANELASVAANSILVVVKVNATTSKAAIPATPNALLPYDVVRGENEISRTGDGMYKNDRPVLERRMPPITDAIKTALANAGCQFKYSNRK